MKNTIKSIVLVVCAICALCCFFFAAATVSTAFWGVLMGEAMLYWFLVASVLGAVVDSRISEHDKEDDT